MAADPTPAEVATAQSTILEVRRRLDGVTASGSPLWFAELASHLARALATARAHGEAVTARHWLADAATGQGAPCIAHVVSCDRRDPVSLVGDCVLAAEREGIVRAAIERCELIRDGMHGTDRATVHAKLQINECIDHIAALAREE